MWAATVQNKISQLQLFQLLLLSVLFVWFFFGPELTYENFEKGIITLFLFHCALFINLESHVLQCCKKHRWLVLDQLWEKLWITLFSLKEFIFQKNLEKKRLSKWKNPMQTHHPIQNKTYIVPWMCCFPFSFLIFFMYSTYQAELCFVWLYNAKPETNFSISNITWVAEWGGTVTMASFSGQEECRSILNRHQTLKQA